jgi:hypothetical protein
MSGPDAPRQTPPVTPSGDRLRADDPAIAERAAPEPPGAPDGPPAEVSDDIVTPAHGDIPVARTPREPAAAEGSPETTAHSDGRGAPGGPEGAHGAEPPGTAIGPDATRDPPPLGTPVRPEDAHGAAIGAEGGRGGERRGAHGGPDAGPGADAPIATDTGVWPAGDTPGRTAAGSADSGSADARGAAASDLPLIEAADAERLRSRWREIQTGFVDDPGVAVAAADEIVGETIRALSAELQRRTAGLRDAAHREGPADTEEMRQALRGYHAIMDRLLG